MGFIVSDLRDSVLDSVDSACDFGDLMWILLILAMTLMMRLGVC